VWLLAELDFFFSISVIPFRNARESHLTALANKYYSHTILNVLSIELRFYIPLDT